MGFLSKMFGGTKDPSKPQTQPAKSQAVPVDQSKPNKVPAQHEAAHTQFDNSKQFPEQAKQTKPTAPAPAAPPAVSKGEEIHTRKYVLTMLSPENVEAREKFLTEFIRRANYVWNPHKIFGRIGLHTDKVKIHIEVQASLDDIEKKIIPWCKDNRLYATHAIFVAPFLEFSNLTHSTPAFKRYDGPWSH